MADISPDLMKMMQSGQQPGADPSQAAQAPVSSPMSTPQDNAGDKQGASAQVQMATKILEQTLIAFGSESEEGKAVLSVLSTLSKQFGETQDKGRALIPSEIMNLMASIPKGAGGQGQGGGQPPQPGMPPGGQPPAGGMPQQPMM